ncbi:MAG: ABC transporter permease [Alphaproteobacteria bacterium]|nr:ABC transporter permease [Alphaproteobacteria bacterium]
MTAATAATIEAAPARRPRALHQHVYWLLILPSVVLMAAFYLYPLVKVLWISVTEPSLGLDNYERLFTSASVQRMLTVTLRISLITTGVSMVLAYIVAYVMVHSSERVQRWMIFFVLVPFWISVLVRAFAWVTLLRGEGIVNNLLIGAGFLAEPLALVRNELGVIIGMIHYMVPFAILPLYANMRGIDQRLVAASRGLGATPIQAFLRVFLPLSLPGIVGAGVLVFIFSTGFYVTPAILGGGKVFMIAEYIAVQINETLRWGLGTMLASTLMIFVFVLMAVLGRFVNLKRLFGAG